MEKAEFLVDFVSSDRRITAHRQPTNKELNFGHGAIHYKDFPRDLWERKDKTLKKWIVCPIDGLRYYR